MRPQDPVEYLAHYLYKYIDNKNNQKKVIWKSLLRNSGVAYFQESKINIC